MSMDGCLAACPRAGRPAEPQSPGGMFAGPPAFGAMGLPANWFLCFLCWCC